MNRPERSPFPLKSILFTYWSIFLSPSYLEEILLHHFYAKRKRIRFRFSKNKCVSVSFLVGTVPFRYANVFNSSLLNITLAYFSSSLHVLFVRVLSNPPLSFCMPGWFFISHDQISFMCYDELCLSTQLIQDDSIIYKWTRERKTDNNLQDESRIFVLSSKCPYTYTHKPMDTLTLLT